MNTTDALSSIQELATRTVDRLHVRLLWSAVEQEAWVSVIDVKRDHTVSVPVGENQSALDVFRHPFRLRGLIARAGLREPLRRTG
jgi:hypothetical protein